MDTSPSKDHHNILLSSQLTALVIIDHQMAFESCFDRKAISEVETGVAELVRAAIKIDIPVIASLLKTNVINSGLSAKLEKIMPQPSRFSRVRVNPWDDVSFVKALETANKPCLIVAGLSAEISLSFTVLCALERGYDVYVVKDACLGHSAKSIETTFDRLTLAGAVPVSWRQVMLEWNQGSIDLALVRRILRPIRKFARQDSTGQE